jgi:hypothetical protein
MPGIDTVTRRILFVETNITVIMPVIDIREVALVLHRQSFKEDHNGYMNVYACENQLDCVRYFRGEGYGHSQGLVTRHVH